MDGMGLYFLEIWAHLNPIKCTYRKCIKLNVKRLRVTSKRNVWLPLTFLTRLKNLTSNKTCSQRINYA